MVKGFKRNTVRRPVRKFRSKRTKMGSRSPIVRSPSGGLRNVNTVRNLTFYPKTIDDKGNITDNWIDKLATFLKLGMIALKYFGILAVAEGKDDNKVAYVTSIAQCIYIGADDLIVEHPITHPVPANSGFYVNYANAKIHRINVAISLMGKMADRAGRLVATLLPISRDQAWESQTQYSGDYKYSDSCNFDEICRYPGAKVGPCSSTLKFSFVPRSSFARSMHTIGDPGAPTGDDSIGGLPICKLYVAYQDYAGNNRTPAEMYGLNEATLSVEVQGCVTLMNPTSDRNVRVRPHMTMPVKSFKVQTGLRQYEEVSFTDTKLLPNGSLSYSADSIIGGPINECLTSKQRKVDPIIYDLDKMSME